MKLHDLHSALETRIPRAYACEWDNDGLMCTPDPDAEVRRVLCTLDVTDDALRYAAENGFDVVLSHHPLIFHKLGALTPDDHIAKKVLFAVQNGISVLSYHTRFDAMPGGMNDLLAGALGLMQTEPFGDGESDMGRIGLLPAEIDIYDFCAQIKRVLHADALLLAKAHDTAHRVAVLGGDGKDFIRGAIAAGADTYVSGRLSYIPWQRRRRWGSRSSKPGISIPKTLSARTICVCLPRSAFPARATIPIGSRLSEKQ